MSGQTEVKKAMKFRSLAVTLTIAFLALSLTILIISNGLQAYFSFQDRQNVIAEQQNFIAREAANEVKDFIDAKSNILGAASRFTDLAETGKEKQKLVLDKLLGFDPSFRQVVLLNAEGRELEMASRVLASASGNLTGRAGSDMLSQASMGKTYISPVYIDEITSEPMIVMAVPVTDVFGDFKGLLMAEVNLKFMWDLVDKIKVGSSGTAYVVDRQGNLLAFSDISRVLKGENLSHVDEVKEFMSTEEGVSDPNLAKLAKGIHGTYTINTHVSLGTPDWAVITELPVAEAYEPIIQQFRITLLIVIANIILVILIAVYLSKRITKPIKILNDAANEIGKGNLDTGIEVVSDDEIGQLASAFKKMTQELQRTTVSKQTLQSILESMPYGVILIGRDKKIQSANRAALSLMGYESEEQIAGLICNKVLCPAEEGKCPIIDLKQKVDRSERVLITKDGRRIPILKSVVQIKLDGRDVLLEAFVDISERKRAEEALCESEEKYRTLVDDASEAIVLIDTNGYLLDANKMMGKLLGCAKEEIINTHFTQLFPEEERERVVAAFEDCLQVGSGALSNALILRKGGNKVSVDVTGSVIELAGKRVVQAILRDITDIKKIEEIRIENKQLAYASKAKSDFLATMSHELRTPLNGIIGFSELLEKKIAGELNEKQEKFVGNIIVSGNHLLNLISDILDLSKVEAGKIELATEDFSVVDAINEGLTLIKEKAMKHNVALKVEREPQLDFIEADKLRFKQILFNLLDNAVKFSKPEGGTVTIAAKREKDMVRFSVSDTGIGIKEEDLKRVFREFDQLDTGISRKYGGTGLGLAITKKLVELNGGTITVESRYGEGSKFTFILPLKAKKKEVH